MLGLSGVALGAWGAHGLTGFLGHDNIGAWGTAVQYQLIHAVAIVALSLSPSRRNLDLSGWLFALGVVVFCGSIYTLVLGGPRWLGPVTPVGGVLFLVGWSLLIWQAWRSHD